MAEVLATFPESLLGSDGVVYRAQAAGAVGSDGVWEGWIEFIPVDGGGASLRTPRETTQPNRTDAAYWATGLSGIYLEGALERALKGSSPHVTPPASVFEEPASGDGRFVEVPVVDTVLDPFEVYRNGETVLRRRLSALEAWHLVNIVVKHRLSDTSSAALEQLSAAALIEIIVTGVRQRAIRT